MDLVPRAHPLLLLLESMSPVEETQKTEKLEGQKKLTNHESTVTNKNVPIHDSNVDKSAGLDADMAPLLLANIFEGLSPAIGSFIDQELYKIKHNNLPPKKAKIIHPKKVYWREAKKEGEIKLTPLNK